MQQAYETQMFIVATLGRMSSTAITDFVFDSFNHEYEAFDFSWDNTTFRSRRAKKTPKKKGYFVAFWQKDTDGLNIPFDGATTPDNLVIHILDGDKKGQFILPKDVLLEQGVIKSTKYKGKMAMRVYPTWERGLNATAAKTQAWQRNYFIDLSTATIDEAALRALYGSE